MLFEIFLYNIYVCIFYDAGAGNEFKSKFVFLGNAFRRNVRKFEVIKRKRTTPNIFITTTATIATLLIYMEIVNANTSI